MNVFINTVSNAHFAIPSRLKNYEQDVLLIWKYKGKECTKPIDGFNANIHKLLFDNLQTGVYSTILMDSAELRYM